LALFLIITSIFWSTPAGASVTPCDTYQVNGGDEAFLMNLNTPLEFGGIVYEENIYVSPKGTITFGQGDYTFWDYPATPSISIGSYDYHAFANGLFWGAENNLYVRYGSTPTSICVDWKVMEWGQSSGDPIYIRMLANVNPDNYTWTPTFQVSSNAPLDARYGVRYEYNGEVFPLTIQTITEPPIENPVISPSPEPTSEPEETIAPTPEIDPTPEIEPTPETISIEEPVFIPTDPDPLPTPEPSELPTQAPASGVNNTLEPVLKPSEAPVEPPKPTPEAKEQPDKQEDDEELLFSMPLIENFLNSVNSFINDLNKVGQDMSPEVREKAQAVVVVSIIVTQIVGVSTFAAMASTSRRS
jgi:hypothetical protein